LISSLNLKTRAVNQSSIAHGIRLAERRIVDEGSIDLEVTADHVVGLQDAAAEIDGDRALRSLDRCAAIVREFVDVPELGREPSVYEFLQSTADTLALFLPLPEHPLRDVRRFAFLPSPLRTS